MYRRDSDRSEWEYAQGRGSTCDIAAARLNVCGSFFQPLLAVLNGRIQGAGVVRNVAPAPLLARSQAPRQMSRPDPAAFQTGDFVWPKKLGC
jgi:hypothetical protein